MDNTKTLLNPLDMDILIVNDCPCNIEAMMLLLKQKGYNIRTVLNGESAIRSVKVVPPDMILLYSGISGMDAYNVCGILRSYEELNEIPIIFINDVNDTIDKEKVFAVGGTDYITHSTNSREAYARIETHLKLRFMQLELNRYSKANSALKKEIVESQKSEEALRRLNSNLSKKILEQTQQLEEITIELKEFNIILEQEINERTKTEEALRESEKQFRYSVEQAPVPIMLCTDDGGIIKISRKWSDITGYSIEDIPTTSGWSEIVSVLNEDAGGIDKSGLKDFGERQNEGEYPVRTKDGNLRIWDFYSAYIGRLQDGRRLLLRIAIDITERKCMEDLQKSVEEERRRLNELMEYDRIKTEFFSNISHELRTPINVIFSALQLHELKLKACSHQIAYGDCNKYTNIMKQNCYRLLRLVNNLIDITKIDSGYFDISKTNCDIISLIENISLSVVDYIENKGLSLIIDTDVEEKIIACDPDMIERIILNLLSNSVKFTPHGGKIMVNMEDNIENICIRIKDTGRGIPEDKLDSIFERFVQVDKSLTRDNEGSGIGLSLVKALVELHCGTISVKSKEGHGTEFIINIPCKLINETRDAIRVYDVIDESCTEKINIEFSDIYS